MFPDHADLPVVGLMMSDAAVIRARGAPECEICGVPPLDVRGAEVAALRWLDEHAPPLAAAWRSDAITHGAVPSTRDEQLWCGTDEAPSRWRENLQRLAWDSRLEPTIALPDSALERVAERLDDSLQEFVEDQLVFTVCGNCRTEKVTPEDAWATIVDCYVRVHFESDRRAAQLQPSWQLIERLTAIIAECARKVG
jgi:hypothetical protein